VDRLIELTPELWSATFETLYVVSLALIFGGTAGLLLGLALYATRSGSLFPHRVVFGVLNVVVNFFRPIPFVILLAAVQPIARSIGIPGIGPEFGIFAITLASMFAISRIVEQNLLTVRPGIIEAARAAGASRSRILLRLIPREALGPLILGYTFIVVALVDMTAIAGAAALTPPSPRQTTPSRRGHRRRARNSGWTQREGVVRRRCDAGQRVRISASP
jgi:D-methionine transport system permease protein